MNNGSYADGVNTGPPKNNLINNLKEIHSLNVSKNYAPGEEIIILVNRKSYLF